MKSLTAFALSLAAIAAMFLAPASASASGLPPQITVDTEWQKPDSNGFTDFVATVASDPSTHMSGRVLYGGVWYNLPNFVAGAGTNAYVIPPFRTSGGLVLKTIELRASSSAQPFMTMSWNPDCGQQAVRWEYISFFSTPLMLAYTNQSGKALVENQRLSSMNGTMTVGPNTWSTCMSSSWNGNRMPTN